MPNIKISVNGVERVISVLQSIPKGIMPALEGFTRVITEALRKPEPYRYVSRKSAYGVSFFSEKQRKWFFANGGSAMIGDHRTGESSRAWSYASISKGYRVSNPTKAAYYTRSDDGQARQPGKVGWLKVKEKISANFGVAMTVFRTIMQQYINR